MRRYTQIYQTPSISTLNRYLYNKHQYIEEEEIEIIIDTYA